MKLRKIIAAVAAAALALGTMAFTASAEYETTIPMYAKDGVTWADTLLDVPVAGNGDYTVSMDVSSIGAVDWGYFMADYTATAPDDYLGATVTINSFKVNGVDWPVAVKSMPLAGDSGTYTFQVFNVWNKENNMLDMTNVVASGQLYAFTDADGAKITIESFDLDFSIDGVGGVFSGDGASTSASTGNASVALIGGIAVVALAGAVVSRKRK